MNARSRRRIEQHLAAKFGVVCQPGYQPPSKKELSERMPQHCRKCQNAAVRRVGLPADRGCFFTDQGRPHWICHACLAASHEVTKTSPGETRLHDWLKSQHIEHTMGYDFKGTEFDCYIPGWNVFVEVDSYSAHHTSAQRKKDHHRNRLAKKHDIYLLRVQWNDRDMIAKVHEARLEGRKLRRQSGSA